MKNNYIKKDLFGIVKPEEEKIYSKKDIEDLIKPYEHLNLECDGMTRIISYILSQKQIKHKIYNGVVYFEYHILRHWWIQLTNGYTVDYRLKMWFPDFEDVPNGIFKRQDFPDFEYKYIKIEKWKVSLQLFNVLTSGQLDSHFRHTNLIIPK